MSKKNRRMDEVETLFDDFIGVVSCLSDEMVDRIFDRTPMGKHGHPRARVIAAATRALAGAGHLIPMSRQPYIVKLYKLGSLQSHQEPLVGEKTVVRTEMSSARLPGRSQS